MKVKEQTFDHQGATISLKSSVINMLENMPSQGGVDAAKKQIELSKKLEECNGTLDVTPEDAVLIRSLINTANHLPPKLQVGMYDAFDVEPEEETTQDDG